MKGKGQAIDWEALRERIKEAETRGMRTPGELEDLYRRRARELARAPAPPAAHEAPFLIFALGRERYGLELSALSEILPLPDCAPLPGASPEVLGLINLRGSLELVVDLSRLLGLPREEASSPHVLILRAPGGAGIRVGQVEGTRPVASRDLVKPEGGGGRAVKGLAPDGAALLDTQELALLLREVCHEDHH